MTALQKKISCSPWSSAALTPASSRSSSGGAAGDAAEPGFELRADLHQQERILEVAGRAIAGTTDGIVLVNSS